MRTTVSENVFPFFPERTAEAPAASRAGLVIDRFDQWSIRADAAVALTGACYCRVDG